MAKSSALREKKTKKGEETHYMFRQTYIIIRNFDVMKVIFIQL